MTTDLTVHTAAGASLTEQMEFARAVTSGGRASSLLPDAYKDNPANVLIAVGLGASMGLSPAESLYRIAVIKGKPSASAELIAANVRKAGHKLRVRVQESPPMATATIIRADDPDEPTTVSRDMEWAKRMGLDGEPNYKKQPATMLSYRAITACARLACPEALYGVAYTPEELDEGPSAARPARTSTGPVTAAEILDPASEADPIPEGEQDALDVETPLTDRTRKHLFALLNDLGITDAEKQRAGMSRILGRPVDSRSSLTEDEGQALIVELEARKAAAS